MTADEVVEILFADNFNNETNVLFWIMRTYL